MRAGRSLWLLAASLTFGCGQPEDVFVLEGTVVNLGNTPLADTEVRLLRDESIDGVRCVPMTLVASARSDAQGRYRFELIRQQIYLGAPKRRMFRVEVPREADNLVSSFTFQFPGADLALPPLPVGNEGREQQGWTDSIHHEVEAFVDGSLAWRGATAGAASEQRPFEVRDVWRQFGGVRVDTDSYGGVEDVAVQARFESPRLEAAARGLVPESRGVPCNVGPAEGPCPLTDGRFLPVRLPPDTRALVITFREETLVDYVWLRGLVVQGDYTQMKLEWSPDTSEAWGPFNTVLVDQGLVQLGRQSCDEPGAFLGPMRVSVGVFPRPRQLRIRFVDDAKDTKPIEWLSEVSVSSASGY